MVTNFVQRISAAFYVFRHHSGLSFVEVLLSLRSNGRNRLKKSLQVLFYLIEPSLPP